MFRDLGWPEILLILVVVMIVFGVGKLPQVGSSLGKAIRGFREASKGEEEKTGTPAEDPKKIVPVAENKIENK